jgi:hypothetical protein
VFHYTDKDGYDAIRSQQVWRFKAAQPPGGHPHGAYFTTLPPDTKSLANKLRIPRRKLAYVFCFVDAGDLVPLPGNRGAYIVYSPGDYEVVVDRQLYEGKTGL